MDSHTYKIMKSPGDGRGVGEISLNLGGDIFGVGGGGRNLAVLKPVDIS